MSRKQYVLTLSQQLVVATALALGASAAGADDSSMRRFGGDSYAYFANQPVINGPSAWRQSHPGGLTNRELQALGLSDLSSIVAQLDPPVLASAPADPTWRQTHPNGLTERELMALSSSSVSRWEVPDGSGGTTALRNIARSPNSETSFARRMFTSSTNGSQ